MNAEQERARAALQTEGEHRQLLQQVEQLNLLRESNIVLRDESARTSAHLSEARNKIARLEAQLIPLQSSVAVLEAETGQLRDEVTARDEEIRAHRGRIQKLLDKYQRYIRLLVTVCYNMQERPNTNFVFCSVDPELHHRLVEEHESLKKRAEEAEKNIEEIQAKHLKLKRAAARMKDEGKFFYSRLLQKYLELIGLGNR